MDAKDNAKETPRPQVGDPKKEEKMSTDTTPKKETTTSDGLQCKPVRRLLNYHSQFKPYKTHMHPYL